MTNAGSVVPYGGTDAEEFARWEGIARQVAAELAETALERDRANRNPLAELELLRRNGLLGFATPREFGGAGGGLTQALRLGRIVSAADGSIGQLLTYHYSNGVWTYLLASRAQWEHVARGVGEKGWFQGSVSNPRDPNVQVTRAAKGLRINGTRTFATGVAVADYITVCLFDGDRPVYVHIPPDRPGLSFGDDWDNLGQRLTASGSVTFDDVAVEPEEILTGLDEFATAGGDPALRDGLRGLFSQLIFATLYLGIAEGALDAAAEYVRDRGRPWPEAPTREATEDPYHLQLFGRLSADVAAGVALADAVAGEYETALAAGTGLTRERWGALAIRLDQLKSVSTEAVLDVTSTIYQATGARSTANSVGLDIYWRNARTHTTHDPVAYRQREIGDYLLNGRLPHPGRLRELARAAARSQGNGS
ncbi:alkylation response protein AidB-like acyl-CoA dehydrogenase [Nocardia transvalensis]|uniref:Alkylation response protein AidB-like acyl-CoA dehydrogenase n=1 Tax=Nocardia transvalensis TaxID=37333 RepID=A0A7W9PAC0_9NOCA|nr:acyl-CoA dehydrogenase family protein [Nocardia transvalensis]MBB5912088.1 alkylation response protein AidB-like acyl-CoA dehydrogenase [Nocardia transvalensis]